MHHRRSPLVQGGLEIPCEITVKMEFSDKKKLAVDEFKRLVDEHYKEPVDGKFLDATNQILEELKSPSDDEELDYSSDESSTEEAED